MAAQRLGQQGPRHGRMVQGGGMELDELDVGRRHAGPQRHGDAVTGRLGRVGGDREELAGPARGQHDVAGPHLDRAVTAPGRQGAHPDAAPALDQEIEGEPPLEHRAGRAERGVDEGPLDLGPGGGAAGVHDPGPGVAALAGQGEQAGGLAVELDAERDQLVHPSGPLVDQDAHRLLVAEARTGRQRVGQVQVGRVLVAAQHRRDPALGPARRRLGQRALGEHTERQGGRGGCARPGQAHRGRQPGDAAAQDQDVEGSRPGPGGHAGSVSVSSASRRADVSSITRLRPSTCTTRGT